MKSLKSAIKDLDPGTTSTPQLLISPPLPTSHSLKALPQASKSHSTKFVLTQKGLDFSKDANHHLTNHAKFYTARSKPRDTNTNPYFMGSPREGKTNKQFFVNMANVSCMKKGYSLIKNDTTRNYTTKVVNPPDPKYFFVLKML